MSKLQIAFMAIMIIGMAIFIFAPGVGTISYISAGLCVVGLLGNIILTFIRMRKAIKEQEKAQAENDKAE